MISFTVLDILILGFCIYQGYRGYREGLLLTLAPLIYWMAAFFFSVTLVDKTGSFLSEYLRLPASLTPVLAFVLTFALIIFIGRAIFQSVNKKVLKSKASPLNKLSGMFVGVIKGWFILSIVFLVLIQFDRPRPEWRNTSSLYPGAASFVDVAWDWGSSVYPEAENLVDRFTRTLGNGGTPADSTAVEPPTSDN